ncbi:MAG: HDOD domain-containing protein [Desulfobulbaceae bacterium]|uniref:histidine kinase n=1 Tax=Candidatus Desulfobia pelagia TaxID=2841692 RepID=A0A8J6NCD3_9BACT|nr:HDOD domain-containing protein [Candidatus Desulfobia pelagia]
MSQNNLENIIDIARLPTLPAVAMEAIRLMDGDAATFGSIADLIKNDQVLAGKILNYANSVYVGARQEITTVPQAISAAGFNAVRSLTLSVSIFDCFAEELSSQRASLVNFWLHSIGVAATAEALARKLDFPFHDEAYLAGLMHDLGKLVCFIQFPDSFTQVCEELERQGSYSSKGSLPLEIEQMLMGVSHIDTGTLIGERYNFPDFLNRAMWLHHQPVVEAITPDLEDLPQLIRFADVLCVTHHVGSSYFLSSTPINHENYHFSLENLVRLHNLTAEDVDGIMTEVHRRVEEVSRVIGFWDEDSYHKLVSSANVSLGSMSMELDQGNRELTETNQVLEATCNMNNKLNPGQTLKEASKVVVDAVCEAFDVSRCLCLIRDVDDGNFVGCSIDGNSYHDFELPIRLADMPNGHINVKIDIEAEAASQLGLATHDLLHGKIQDSKIIKMVTGSRFMATFFMAGKDSRWRKEQLLGELVVDFSSGPDFVSHNMKGLSGNFESMASSIGTAIERILLEIDLTRQAKKLAETSRKMEENQRQLFQSHRLATVGRLAAGAAHEINNPLTIISLNLQLIKRLLNGVPDNVSLLERVKIIADQEHRISQIIQDLMGFARPSEPKFDPIDLAALVDKVFKLFHTRVEAKRLEVVINIPPDFPRVLIDSQQIEQVFMNLFLNAYHAMPDGGTLTVDGRQAGEYVDVVVSDTGSGISKENLSKVFDPFFTTKMEGEGMGLGLAVCHSIVEHNRGNMKVSSEVGKGSSFVVSLPMDKSSRLRELKSILKTKKKEQEVSVGQERPRLLVIDDERVLNDILQETLRAADYQVEGAYDGVEGIEKLRYRKFDLVLLDIRMPRKDGLDVLKFVRREYPDVKVIIITGLASLPEIKETVKLGAFACLKKPFLLERVLETIEKALAGEKSEGAQ